jgi:hypothetical protein
MRIVAFLALVAAQVYEFIDEALPPPRSLHVVYSFYVFGVRHPSDKRGRDAFVKVHKVALSNEVPGVSVILVPHETFWEAMSPQKFCCHEQDAAAGKCRLGGLYAESQLDYHYKLSASALEEKKRIDKGGAYFLAVANCGDSDGVRISGQVILKHTYGFLNGLEWAKLPFYGNLSLGYMGLAAWWTLQSATWWKQIGTIHVCIVVVIVISLLEAAFWWEFYSDWNRQGVYSRTFFFFAISATVLKSAVSYMLLLVASLGWGVTRPYLERELVLRVLGVGAVFVFFDAVREVMLSFRHSHSVPPFLVLVCLVPVSMLVAGIFVWVFASLASLMKALSERKQMEKLRSITALWRVLCASLAAGTISLLYQMSTFHVPIADRWHTHWLLTDGVSHGIFFLVLVCIMYLWAPHGNSEKYSYSAADDGDHKGADKDDEDIEPAPHGDQPDSDDEYWTNIKVGSASIGAPSGSSKTA